MSTSREPTVAVLIPCHNEGACIASVVSDFKKSLPDAMVFVYDNNSTDDTVSEAQNAGAIVRSEPLQGKGNVVRRMFSDIDADIYILVDGDNTYDAASAPAMIEKFIDEHLDMLNGARVSDAEHAYRPGHRFGNAMLTGIAAGIFGDRISDMLSGYRIFSRRFVKSFPVTSSGFEIETEFTIHALELNMPMAELQTPYKERPDGSESKLHTVRDGIRILKTIIVLVKEERPLQFFLTVSVLLAMLSLGLAWPILIEYIETGLVPRFPTAILATGIMVLAFMSMGVGLILDTVSRGRKEMKRIAYLSVSNRWQ